MSNPYYTPSGAPAQGGPGQSAAIRAEFNSVKAAFDLLPALNPGYVVRVNAGGTALEGITPATALAAMNGLDATTAASTYQTQAGMASYQTTAGMSSYILKANNLSDVANAATARSNLGLGSAATLTAGTAANNAVQLDGSAKLPAVDGSQLTNLPASGGSKIQSVASSVAANALTLTYNGGTLDFRSPALTNGVPNTRTVGSISLTVPSGATLGTVSGVAARLMLLVMDNAGAQELAVVNEAGGLSLDESALISTTALSAASNSANVIYSTTARTGLPFRFGGYVDITEAAAGTWATDATVKQGAGGNVLLNQEQAEVTIASATTTNIGAVPSRNVNISGAVAITSLGLAAAGVVKSCRASGAFTLTHNATSLICPNNGSNIVAASGDCFQALSLGSGNWVIRSYTKANGQALQGAGVSTDAGNLGVGTMQFLANTSAGSVAAGSTIAGSSLKGIGYQTTGGTALPAAITGSAALSGTWRNISGMNCVANGSNPDSVTFQRTA